MNKNSVKINRKMAYLFQIKLDSTSKEEVLRNIRVNLRDFEKKEIGRKKLFIVTPNPEQILLGQKDRVFTKIINSATFSLPDGIGLLQAIKYLNLKDNKKNPLRFLVLLFQGIKVGISTFYNKKWLEEDINLIHGRDMMIDIVRLANNKGWKVVFLGGKGDVAKKCAENLKKNYKNAKFLGLTGPMLNDEAKPISQEDRILEMQIIKEINIFAPHIVFIGFGAPKQEKWVYKWLTTLNIGGAMVVGGALDYIAGKVKVPPEWITRIELEWLWRLFSQKGRVKRVLTAFPVFPLKVFLYKLRNRNI